MQSDTLGSYLKSARLAKNLTAIELANLAGLDSPLSVVTWEKDHGDALPLPVLQKLVQILALDIQLVFDLLLKYQLTRIEEKLNALERRVR